MVIVCRPADVSTSVQMPEPLTSVAESKTTPLSAHDATPAGGVVPSDDTVTVKSSEEPEAAIGCGCVTCTSTFLPWCVAPGQPPGGAGMMSPCAACAGS